MLPTPAAAPPPAPVPAAAFSAGSVIGRSFSTWFANFVPFSVVTLAIHAPLLVYAAVTPEEGGAGWALGNSLVSGLAGFVTTGALTYGVLEHLRGGRARLGALFQTGLRRMGWVFLVSLGVGLWTLLGIVLFVVPGVVWYCGLFVAVPAVVVEPILGTEALQRSRELTKGSRWGILVVFLVVIVVTVASSAAAALVATLAAAVLPRALGVVLTTALVALATTFAACAPAVAYHDLRVAKEGIATADLVKVFE